MNTKGLRFNHQGAWQAFLISSLLINTISLGQDHVPVGFGPRETRESKVNQAYLSQCADEKQKPVLKTPEEPGSKQASQAALFQSVKAILSSKEHKCTECHAPGSKKGSKNFENILDFEDLISKGMLNLDNAEESKLHL